jgi:hypothetical protein
MLTKSPLRALALSVAILLGSTGICQAQISQSRTTYSRDAFGRLIAVRVQIALPQVNHFYVFNLPAAFLKLPVATQVKMLDQQYGLGADAKAVEGVLNSLQQQQRDQQIQNNLQRMQNLQQQQLQIQNNLQQQQQLQDNLRRQMDMQRLQQPPFVPPPVFQPPPPPVIPPPINIPR